MTTSIAARSHADLDACTQEFVAATASILSIVKQAAETAATCWATKERVTLDKIIELGEKMLDDIRDRLVAHREASVKVQELKAKWLASLDEKDNEIEQLSQKHQAILVACAENERILGGLRRTRLDVEQKLEQLQQQSATLEEEARTAMTTLRGTQSEDNALKSSIQLQRQAQTTENLRLAEWSTQLSNEKKKHAEVDSRQKKLRSELERGREDHNSRVNAALEREKETARIGEVNASMRGELDQATETLRSVTGLIDPSDDFYSVTQEAKTIADAVVAKLSTLNYDIACKQKTIWTQLERIRVRDNTIDQRAHDIQALKVQQRQLQADNDNLRGSNSVLSTESASKEKKIQMQLQTIELKDSAINQRAEDIQALKVQQRQLQARNYDFRGSNSILSTEIDRLKLRVRELNQTAELSLEEYRMLERSKEALQSQNVQQSQEIERLQQAREKQAVSLRSARQEREQLNEECVTMRLEVPRLEQQLSTATRRRREIAKERDQLKADNKEAIRGKDVEIDDLRDELAVTAQEQEKIKAELADERRKRIRHEQQGRRVSPDTLPSNRRIEIEMEDDDYNSGDQRPLERPRASNPSNPANDGAFRHSSSRTGTSRPRTYGQRQANTDPDGGEPCAM
ncbi:MAG: hypothetical protein Q9196_004365 [Gyalolechia fulgens]